jgi:hypothetical protein
MALQSAANFAYQILGDGSSTSGSFNLKETFTQLTGSSIEIFEPFKADILPSGATQTYIVATVSGSLVRGTATVSITGATMSVTLSVVPDAGTIATLGGIFTF